jgi:hypothetical protein
MVFSSGVGPPRSNPRNRIHESRSRLSAIAWQLPAGQRNHELHPRIREVVLGLQDQRLEHRNRIEGRPPALRTVAVAKTLDQPAPEIFETRRRIENLERIAVRAQRVKLLRQSAKKLR